MTASYTRTAIALHWAIALLILVNWPLGFFSDAIKDALGFSLMWIHKSIGLTVLALSLVRLGWRLAHKVPTLPAAMPAWERLAANGTHILLYGLMIGLPLTGWIMSSAGKYPLDWFHLFPVPKFAVEKGSVAALGALNLHGAFGWIIAALLILHIGAALRHHLILKDAILRRMLPTAARN